MTLILDAGGISALAGQRDRLMELRARGLWPAQVPSVVLAESLTGDHRRDFHANRPLAACQIRDVTEPHARKAARLRTATGRRAQIRTIGMAADAHSCMCARGRLVTRMRDDFRGRRGS